VTEILTKKMQNASLEELRRFVTARDGQQRFGPSTLSLTVSHSNLVQRWIEIRFDLEETVGGIKLRLYRHGGTPPEAQKLQLLDSAGRFVCEMVNDKATLRQYGAQNNMEIRIVDLDANSLAKSGWLEDTSLVEKYVMPDEVYDARKNTVRKFKQQEMEKEKLKKADDAASCTMSTVDENLTVGKRCEVGPGARRGEVRFVGEAEVLGEGVWVGVALDEPMGKNDGTVKGKRFFTCPANHGVMVRPEKVTVGEFPVRDLLGDEDESDDEI
jgi:tubulin-folding cofactor B